MIKTFCDNVISVYTYCESVVAIYTYCDEVWTSGGAGGNWYVSWTPDNLSGSFTMFSGSERLEDFSGYYSWTGRSRGYIPNRVFVRTGMRYMETNVKSIDYGAFFNCSDMSEASMSRVKRVGNTAFGACYSLRSVYLPVCEYVGMDAFESCVNLEYISMPLCLEVDSTAFQDCTNMSYARIPNCSRVHYQAFDGCTSLEEIYAPKVQRIDQRAFRACVNLEYIDFPECSYIEGEAFIACSSLKYVSLPELVRCEDIFEGCTALSSIYLPAVESVIGTFIGCTSLRDVSLPVCSSIGNWTFSGCTGLRFIELEASYIGIGAFLDCHNLISAHLSQAQVIGTECFRNCYSLENISLPSLTSMDHSAFMDCSVLYNVNLGQCSRIGKSAFYNCASLHTLTLEYEGGVCSFPPGSSTTYDTDVFANTPFSRCVGSIFVPSSLVASYKQHTGWASLSCIIQPISSSPGPGPGPGPEPDYWSMTWTPTTLGGTIRIGGTPYSISSYRGIYSTCPYSVMGSSTVCFISCSFSTFTTDIVGIESFYAFSECSIGRLSASMCEYVGRGAFQFCPRLTSVYLPKCSYIDDHAFYETKYMNLYLMGESVVVLGSSIWSNLTSVQIIVPSSLYSDYRSMYSYYRSRIISA